MFIENLDLHGQVLGMVVEEKVILELKFVKNGSKQFIQSKHIEKSSRFLR